MDNQNTFLLVAKMTSVRIFISLVVTCHWPLHQLNVKNTYLNGVLDKEVYMGNHLILLLGGSGKVYRLKKSLYGLK